jgi:RND family efflux transporter MFP subunit
LSEGEGRPARPYDQDVNTMMRTSGRFRGVSAWIGVVCGLVAAGGLTGVVKALDQPGGPAAKASAPGVSAEPDGWNELGASFGGVATNTKPSRDVLMRFGQPTEIREVKVHAGQRVKAGDLLIKARDSEFLPAIEQQKLRSESVLEIKAAEADLELAEFRFKNQQAAKEKSAFSETEYEEARIALETKKVQLDQAKFNHDQEKLRYDQAVGQYERLRLEAPFDGIVEQVIGELGQGVNEQMDVIRVVDVSRLWLEAYAPVDQTIALKLGEGSPAWVLLDVRDGVKVLPGKVLHASPVADSVSGLRRVRVEIDNKEGLPAGLRARVRFTAPEGRFAGLGAPVGAVEGTAGPTDGREVAEGSR